MPIPFKLDYVIEKVVGQNADKVRTIKRLSGVKLERGDAKAHWPRLLEHKWYLSERLNRDVGLRVAAVDYFENIYQPPPITYRGRFELPEKLPMMLPLSMR